MAFPIQVNASRPTAVTPPVTKAQVVYNNTSNDQWLQNWPIAVAALGFAGVVGWAVNRFGVIDDERDGDRDMKRGRYLDASYAYRRELNRIADDHDASDYLATRNKSLHSKLADAYYQLARGQTNENLAFGPWMLAALVAAGDTQGALHKTTDLIRVFERAGMYHATLALLDSWEKHVKRPNVPWAPGSERIFTANHAEMLHVVADREAANYDPAKDASRNGYGLIARRYAKAVDLYETLDLSSFKSGVGICRRLAADYYLKSAWQSMDTDPTQARHEYWQAFVYANRQVMDRNAGFISRVLDAGLRAVMPTRFEHDQKVATEIAQATVALATTKVAVIQAQLDLATQYFLSGKIDLASTTLQAALGEPVIQRQLLKHPVDANVPLVLVDPLYAALESARRLLPEALPSFDVVQLRLVWITDWLFAQQMPRTMIQPAYQASAEFDILRALHDGGHDAARSVELARHTSWVLSSDMVRAIFSGQTLDPQMIDKLVDVFPEYRRSEVRDYIGTQVAHEEWLRDRAANRALVSRAR